MAYTLNKTDGSELVILADGVNDTSTTNLTLIGKNTTSYGEALNENFIKLLENFSRSSAPSAPIEGQLWWDNVNKILAVYQGTVWKSLSHAAASISAPADAPASGDLWWDSTTSQLKAYSGSAWLLVGPQTPAGTPTTAFTGNSVTDTLSASHTVGNLTVNNKLFAIVSTDATPFTPIITYTGSGITRVNPGINFTSTAESTMISSPSMVMGVSAGNVQITSLQQNYGFNITANVAGTPRSVMHISGTTGDAVFGGNVSFPSSAPVSISQISSNVSPTANLTQSLGSPTSYWSNVYVANVISSGTSSFNRVVAGNITTTNGLFWANGVSCLSSVTVDLSSVSQNILPSANLSYNLGSPAAYWNNVYGKAIQAQYADLAERFHADAEYSAGTVVELGGPAEITAAAEELSEAVFGVISTQAAYLMNSGAGSDQTHPPIAVQGRVPVKVIGRIRKGDRLVSAGGGLARAGSRSEITTWNVIGRALEHKMDDGIGVIEAVVKLNS